MQRKLLLVIRNYDSAKRVAIILLTIGMMLLFVIPAFATSYTLHLVLRVLFFVVFCLGTNILLGHTGLLSFGQGAFYGAGGYIAGLILEVYPNIVAGVLGGVIGASVLAAIVGFFSVRHTAIYFAMITLAFSMMIWALVERTPALGAYYGLYGIPRGSFEIPNVFSISLAPVTNYYIFGLGVSLLAIFLYYRIVHSPLGLTLHGVRDNENRLALTGVPVWRIRWISFIIAGAFCGLAGALLSPLTGTVTPLTFHWSTSVSPVIGSLMGGIYSFSGPIVGGATYFVMRELILRQTANWMLPMGLMTIAIVLGFRKGIVGSIQDDVIPWLRARLKRGEHR